MSLGSLFLCKGVGEWSSYGWGGWGATTHLEKDTFRIWLERMLDYLIWSRLLSRKVGPDGPWDPFQLGFLWFYALPLDMKFRNKFSVQRSCASIGSLLAIMGPRYLMNTNSTLSKAPCKHFILRRWKALKGHCSSSVFPVLKNTVLRTMYFYFGAWQEEEEERKETPKGSSS